jgi:hypothetical protein
LTDDFGAPSFRNVLDDGSSDRNLKENFQPVSPGEVLQKVAAMPITRWNFKKEKGIEHVGPMAQDFHEAFEVGMDERHIATVDEGGVALAAIQGLNQKVEERETKIQEQEAEIAALKEKAQRVDALEKQNDAPAARLNDLEAAVKALAQKK